MTTKRISLWSSPRNISTALMYSFAQRADTTVIDEPFYGYYLSKSKASEYHPGSKEILETMETNETKIIDQITGEFPTPIVFLKNMSHHQLDMDLAFIKQLKNIILTRDPKDMILSFIKTIPNPTMKDIGYKQQADLIDKMKSWNLEFISINSKDILKNPKESLKKICKWLNIPFDKSMISWPKGPIAEDGIWADYWYENVHKSTKFGQYKEKNEELPTYLEDLLEECYPYYQKIMEHSIL